MRPVGAGSPRSSPGDRLESRSHTAAFVRERTCQNRDRHEAVSPGVPACRSLPWKGPFVPRTPPKNPEIGWFWGLCRQGGQQYNRPWFFSIAAIETVPILGRGL